MAPRKATSPRKPDLYRKLFERSRDSMIVLEFAPGGEPRVIDANPAALALHGFTRRGLIGKPVSALGASLTGRGFGDRAGGPYEVRHVKGRAGALVTEVTARTFRLGKKNFGMLIERDVTLRRSREEDAREVSGRLMQEREEEKKRLAAGLHDALGAMSVGLSAELALLKNCVAGGRRRSALAGIARAGRILKEHVSGLKKSCAEAWPQSLSVSGLGGAVSDLLEKFSRRSGMKVCSAIDTSCELCSTGAPAAIVIYRLAQEALANAERHSGASQLELALDCSGGWIDLEVRDNGRGFDTGAGRAEEGCLGLKIMEDAANGAGGYFSVYSSPGGGVRVKAQVPLCGSKRK